MVLPSPVPAGRGFAALLLLPSPDLLIAACMAFHCWCLQAEALQQLRQELMHLETALQAQQAAVEQLAGERDACKAGAHEASDRSKVNKLAVSSPHVHVDHHTLFLVLLALVTNTVLAVCPVLAVFYLLPCPTLACCWHTPDQSVPVLPLSCPVEPLPLSCPACPQLAQCFPPEHSRQLSTVSASACPVCLSKEHLSTTQ